MVHANTARRLKALATQMRHCTLCPLYKSRTLAVPGEGKPSANVRLIGEAPGKEEDESGHPFVGAAGRLLTHLLKENGLRRDEVFITNIVKCRPPHNRAPRKNEIETCTTHYLFTQIACVNPKLIVLLGGVAAKTLLGVTTLSSVRGRLIEHEARTYLVSYHPAAGFYRETVSAQVKADFAQLAQVLKAL